MNALFPLLGLGLASVLTAQSPLTTTYTSNTGLTAGAVMFFNMAVNTTITINRIDVNVGTASPVGTRGEIRFWQTNAPIVSHVGSENAPGNWTLLGTAPCLAQGVGVASPACFPVPMTIAPGTRGYAVEYVGLHARYVIGTASNTIYTNAEITLTAGAAYSNAFFPTQGHKPFMNIAGNFPRVFNGAIHYELGSFAPVCSRSSLLGYGCGGYHDSFYDWIELPADAAVKMSNRQIIMSPAGGGYTVAELASPGLIDATSHPILTGWATTIAANVGFELDDGQVTVPLSSPFPFPGGVTSNLYVNTNGHISAGDNLAAMDAFTRDDWGGFVPGLLGLPHAMWCAWHDYDLSGTGGGNVKALDTGTSMIVTYEGVESAPTGAGNPSTFQFVFDYATGTVTLTFGTITGVGANATTGLDGHLIGFSPGGISLLPVESDVSTDSVYGTAAVGVETATLSLSSSPRPLAGTLVNYLSSAPGTFPHFGVLFLSVSNPFGPAGLDLAFVGAPGCGAWVDIGVNVQVPQVGVAGPYGYDLMTDNSFLGLDVFAQAAWLDAAANGFGIVTSNAVQARIEAN